MELTMIHNSSLVIKHMKVKWVALFMLNHMAKEKNTLKVYLNMKVTLKGAKKVVMG